MKWKYQPLNVCPTEFQIIDEIKYLHDSEKF